MFHLASQQLHYGGFPRCSGIDVSSWKEKNILPCVLQRCATASWVAIAGDKAVPGWVS